MLAEGYKTSKGDDGATEAVGEREADNGGCIAMVAAGGPVDGSEGRCEMDDVGIGP